MRRGTRRSETGLCWRRCFLCSSPVDAVGGGYWEEEGMMVHRVKLLMKYLVHDFKLETPLAASIIAQWSRRICGDGRGRPRGGGDDYLTPRLCTNCASLVGSISKLQLELEVIQMKIVSALEVVRKAVINNSRLYGGNDGVKQDFEELEEMLLKREANGGDCSTERTFLDAIHHLQTFVFENGSKHLHIPLVYLDKFTGKKINVALSTMSTDLNLEPVVLHTDKNFKDEPEDYSEPMEEADNFDFDLSLPHEEEVALEAPPSRRARTRKPAQQFTASVRQSMKKPKLRVRVREQPAKELSQAQLLYKQILRENHSKKWKGGQRPRETKPVKSRREFTCDECGLNLNNTVSLTVEQHLKEHEEPLSGRNNYECPDCKICFSQKQYFELHLSYHSHVHKECEICSERLPLAELEAHLKSHQERNFGCQFCSLWCPTFESLANHLSYHKLVSVKCELCPEDDSTKYHVQTELRRHLSECHGGKDRFEYKCPFDGCSEVFYTQNALYRHRNVHKKVHTCSVCDKSLQSAKELKRHTRLEHPADVTDWFACDADDCEQKFPTESTLLRHQILEHDKPKLKCEFCTKEFLSVDTRRLHARIEHKVGKELPKYNCTHCGKLFRDKLGWREHEAIHTREKKFTCEICGFGTHVVTAFRKHKQIHDEKRERKFQCPHCPPGFTKRRTS